MCVTPFVAARCLFVFSRFENIFKLLSWSFFKLKLKYSVIILQPADRQCRTKDREGETEVLFAANKQSKLVLCSSGISFKGFYSQEWYERKCCFLYSPHERQILQWLDLHLVAGIGDNHLKVDGVGRCDRGRSTGSSNNSSSHHEPSGNIQEPAGDPCMVVSPSREHGPGCRHPSSLPSGPEPLCCHSNTAAPIHQLDWKFRNGK